MAISDFINLYSEKIATLTDNTNGDKELLESNLTRLKQINELLFVDKFKLVFIGEPGSGKTTTICNYLNLTTDLTPGKAFENVELFNTGSGRTTAFEVHYIKSDETKFEIYPMRLEEQKALLNEYLGYMWNKTFDIEQDTDEPDNQSSSREYDRIIRNMLGFSSENEFQTFIESDYSADMKSEYLDEMNNRVAFENRCIRSIIMPENVKDVKAWIKDTFNSINNGKNIAVAIPDRVDVLLCQNDIDFYFPDFVSEIIDTRGYDGNTRDDLIDYLKDKNSISIIMDEPKALPGERQKKILTEWIIKEDVDIIPRIAMFVKDKGNELANVNEADGDEEKGEEIKRNELERAVNNDKINYRIENTLFIDSYYGIITATKFIETANSRKKKKNIIEVCDEELRNDERMRVTNHFETMINAYKEYLNTESKKLMSIIENLFQEIESPSINRQMYDSLKKTVHYLIFLKDGLINTDNGDIIISAIESKYCNYFRKSVHWNSARKTTTMAGTWYKADIYSEYRQFIINQTINILSKNKDRMIRYIEENKKYEDIVPFVDACIEKINNDFLSMTNKIKDSSYRYCINCFTKINAVSTNNDLPSLQKIYDYRLEHFWDRAINVYGGQGYYGRLMDCFINHMYSSTLAQQTNMVIKAIVEKYYDNIIKLLNDKKDSINSSYII